MTKPELRSMKRHRQRPYWSHPVITATLQTLAETSDTGERASTEAGSAVDREAPFVDEEEDVQGGGGPTDDDNDGPVAEWDVGDEDEEQELSVGGRFSQARDMVKRILALLDREQPFGSRAFIDHFWNTNGRNRHLLRDVDTRLNAARAHTASHLD
ncbi:unnamed protein product [Tilletia controversa]|uniref:Uncharacterized protein n=1 Tax=Tilletia controversa TaxID=13291 RepID=A0A8X7MLU3_9BASI|nr:hypothetical protein A4X06_0g7507 [Tilletia controversa]CAD6892336.1 unnamed protein product [Tilletia caries]CAD6953432.1 unnamed protein product [Tilletia laevis]CAD6943754.1 unnamed protein product [Tilletia controversa]CAD6945007.1 unnamed protein product [Tilletia controversa]